MFKSLVKCRVIIIYFFLITNYLHVNASEINKQVIEKEIIQEQKNYTKNLYLIKTNLMNLENKINYTQHILKYISNNNYENSFFPIENLKRAKRHLLLGNAQAAIDEVNNNFNYINLNDENSIFLAYKILFEANIILGKYEKSADICYNIMRLNYKNDILFDDKWKMLCSYTFLEASKKKFKNDFKDKLVVWSLSPIIQKNDKYYLLSSIFISLAQRNIYKNKNVSIDYLYSTISKSKDRDPYLGKAYLALALMYFELGEKDKSYSIIRDIVLDLVNKNKQYKYFVIDNYTRLLAKICFARLYATYGNLEAAETWYEDTLREKKVTGIDIENREKNKIKFEYAKILYKEKKYIKSANIFKDILEQSQPNDLFFEQYNIKISKIILANILNKAIEISVDSDLELINLYKTAKNDLEFINNNKNIKNNHEDITKKIITISALAKDYGLETKEAKLFIQYYLSIAKLSSNLPKNKSNFVNSINSINYIDEEVHQKIIQSCINKIKDNLIYLKQNFIEMDKISYIYWNNSSKKYDISFNTRNNFLKSLYALDDEISSYNNFILKNSIYKNKLLLDLVSINNEINKTKSLNASVKFLNNNQINNSENKILNLEKNLLDSTLFYRKLIAESKIFPINFYLTKKIISLYHYLFYEMYILHKNLRKKSVEFSDSYDLIEKNWKKLIQLNNQNKKLLEFIIEIIEIDRKKTINSINEINNKIILQEKFIDEIKINAFSEYKKFYPILLNQLQGKIEEFQGYIKISLAEHNKNIYELNKDNLPIENDLIKSREKLIESFQKSINFGLFR